MEKRSGIGKRADLLVCLVFGVYVCEVVRSRGEECSTDEQWKVVEDEVLRKWIYEFEWRSEVVGRRADLVQLLWWC